MSDALPYSSRHVANVLAVRAVRHASEFLQRKDGHTALGMNAEKLQLELMLTDPAANSLLNPVRLLNVAMMSAARAAHDVDTDPARLDRWMQVMGSLVGLVEHERVRFAREQGPLT